MTPLPPDSADALRVWLRFLRLHQRLQALAAQELRRIGLSVPQFDVLSTLSEREGVTQNELAARLYVTKGNVSGLVDRLVAAGLVERRCVAGDRRSHALHLTEAGRALQRTGAAGQRAFVAGHLGQLSTEDVATLERLLIAWRETLRRAS